ncbi:MAG: hypothetical protein OXL41_10505 [Nitrospinae bacterium]|nr:hypothetical protein [Nitrospinota bacterium]
MEPALAGENDAQVLNAAGGLATFPQAPVVRSFNRPEQRGSAERFDAAPPGSGEGGSVCSAVAWMTHRGRASRMRIEPVRL